MKVLLTGGSGFIGRHVLAALQRKDIDVVTVGRRSIPESVKNIETDLLAVNDLIPMLKEVQATHLLHLAWEAEADMNRSLRIREMSVRTRSVINSQYVKLPDD